MPTFWLISTRNAPHASAIATGDPIIARSSAAGTCTGKVVCSTPRALNFTILDGAVLGFTDLTIYAGSPSDNGRAVSSFQRSGGLFCWFPVWNNRAAGKRVITKSRLPVPGDYELSAVQELGSIQKSSGKISAIKHRLEEVRAVQMRT